MAASKHLPMQLAKQVSNSNSQLSIFHSSMPPSSTPSQNQRGGNNPRGGRGNDRGNRRDRAPQEFTETTLSVDRVTRVVKGGRRMRFRAVVIVGNHKGKVGMGTGKANEVQAAVQKAVKEAKRSLVHIPLTKSGSIPHEVEIKFKAARLRILPASEGTGVLAGGALRVVFEHAGVRNVLSKRFGTNNKLVNAQAIIEALSQLRHSGTLQDHGIEDEADKSAPKVQTVSKKDAEKQNRESKKAGEDVVA